MEPAVLSLCVLCGNELIKTDASTLLHSFEDESEVDRQFDSQVLVCFENVEPSQDRTLVIGRSTSNELAVIGNGQSEWIGSPSIAP